MDGGGAVALLIFVGLIIALFPRESRQERKPEPKPETYVELPQGEAQYPFAGGYPGYPMMNPYQGMGYPQVSPIVNGTVGGHRILKVGNRVFIQQQLPYGTGSGNDEGGSHG